MSEQNSYNYKPAKLNYQKNDLTKKWYVEFWAWSIDIGKLKRKRIFKVNDFKSVKERKKFADKQIKEINKLLANGFHFDTKKRKKTINVILINDGKKRLTIKDELYLIYNETKNAYRKKTNEATKTIINRFVRFVNIVNENYTINDINLKIANEFQAYLLNVDNLANVTVNKTISYIKRFFNEFVKDEKIYKNPFEHVKSLPVLISKKNQAFSKEQIKILKPYLIKYDLQLWHYIQFIFWCYLRPKEIRNLQVKHILLNERKLYIPPEISKNKKGAYLYLSDKMIDTITSMNIDYSQKNAYIFSGKNYCGADKLGVNNMYKRFKCCLIDLDIKGDFTLYSWKHTGVVIAYNSGIDIKSIQLQCRHSDISITDRYLKSLGFIDNFGFMSKINEVKF